MLHTYLLWFWWKWTAYRTTRYYRSANGPAENDAAAARQTGFKLLCSKAKNEFPHLHVIQNMASISGHSVAFWEDAAFHTKVEWTWSQATSSFDGPQSTRRHRNCMLFGIGIRIQDDFWKLKKRSVKKKIMEVLKKKSFSVQLKEYGTWAQAVSY